METMKCNTCGRYTNAMRKTSAPLINLRDNLLEIEEDFKQTTMILTKDNNRNMNKLTSLFYRFYVENIAKIKGYGSKKVAVTKISENERLVLLIIGKALGFAFNANFKARTEKIF